MSPRKAPIPGAVLDALLAKMDSWAESWSYVPEDVPVGEGLVVVLRKFIRDLHSRGLSKKTLRRHLDSAWAIGGEVVRGFNHEPERRSLDPLPLLLDAVAGGLAPLLYRASEGEQAETDVTARKLERFLEARQGRK